MRRTRQQKRQNAAVDLRREAIDRECQIRLPGCVSGPCCLAHWRQSGISGLGMKAPDAIGAWACHPCHSRVDSSQRDDESVQLDFARAVFRTQAILIAEEKIQW